MRKIQVITCREVTEKANDYVDGKLGFWPAMEVRMHLLVCRYCRAFVKQIRTVVDLVRATGSVPRGDAEHELLNAFRKRSGGAPE